MDFQDLEYIEIEQLKDSAINCIISFDGIYKENKIHNLVRSVFDWPNKKSKKFFAMSTNSIDDYSLEIVRKLLKNTDETTKIFHFELVEEFDSQKCRVLKNNILITNFLHFDMINAVNSKPLEEKLISGDNEVTEQTCIYVATLSRRKVLEYRYSESNILNSFKNNLLKKGEFEEKDKEMFGDSYYTAKFASYRELLEFKEFVTEQIPLELSKRRKKSLTGEDIDMFNERKQESKSSEEKICDTHMDGA